MLNFLQLQGVLTLKNTYFEPRYVLVMPLDKEAHEKRLRDRGRYTEEEIAYTLRRADIYCKYNQDHPGFFDMMINSGKCFFIHSMKIKASTSNTLP